MLLRLIMLHREPEKKSLFENRFKYKIVSGDEMRIIAKANEQCFYYLAGIEKCAERVALNSIKQSSDTKANFYDCKPVTEAYFRCVTKDQYGTQLESMEQEVRPYFKNFTKCVFTDLKSIDECRRFHDDILRHYARQADNKLDDIYS